MKQDNKSMQMLRQDMIKHLNGRTKVEAKYPPSYPYTAEREYFRLVNSYMSESIRTYSSLVCCPPPR